MTQALLFLHFFGLMLGAAGGMSSGLIMRKAVAMPADHAKVLRGLGPMLANVSAMGLVLLWVTGIVLIWSTWNGLGSLPSFFWVKALFILSLTVASFLIHRTYAEIHGGNAAAATRLPVLGQAAGASAVLAVLSAVISFS